MNKMFFQPLKKGTPHFSEKEVKSFLNEKYLIEGLVSVLPSYYDQNFLIENDSECFVVKIANNSRPITMINFENKVMRSLFKDKFPVQESIISKSGSEILKIRNNHNEEFLFRVFKYISGKTLSSIEEISDELLEDLGRKIAVLENMLTKFSSEIPVINSYWDLKNAKENLIWENYLPDKGIKDIVTKIVSEFDSLISKLAYDLQEGVIHGDLNLANLLVNNNSDIELKAVIDFGEVKLSYKIFDLAIACMYVGLKKEDPLSKFAKVIKGYNSVNRLSDADIKILFPAICTRICVSTIIAYKSSSESPENEYIKAKCIPNIELLQKVNQIRPDIAELYFKANL